MGYLKDKINKIRADIVQATRQRIMDEADLQEDLGKYRRGTFDVYPEQINSQYVTLLRRNTVKALIIKCIVFASTVFWALVCYRCGYDLDGPVIYFSGTVGGPLIFWAYTDISRLIFFIRGKYDTYGAMINYAREYSPDTDSDEPTIYYLIALNGVEIKVSHFQYKRLRVGQYVHFVRFKSKYRANDSYYFFIGSTQDEKDIIGYYNPTRELRLFRAEKGINNLSFVSLFSISNAILLFARASANPDTSFMKSVVLPWALLIIGAVVWAINKKIISNRNREKLEQMRRERSEE